MGIRCFLSLLAAVLLGGVAGAQKRLMRPDDYKSWEFITARDISSDGRWIWYDVGLVSGDSFLVLKNNDDARNSKVPNAASVTFSDDSQWIAYLTGPSKTEADKLRADKKPIITKLTIRSLDSGQERSFDDIQSYRMLKGSNTVMALRRAAQPGPEVARDLLIIDLRTGKILPIQGVSEAVPNEKSSTLAIVFKSPPDDEGIELLDLNTYAIHPLEFGKKHARHLVWSKDGSSLAFFVGDSVDGKIGDFNSIEEVRGLPNSPASKVLDPTGKPWLKSGKRISEVGPLELNDDGSVVGFGIGDWFVKPKPDEKAHPEVWNSKDLRVVPEQRVTAASDRDRTDLTVWRPSNDSVLTITDGWKQDAILLKGFSKAVLVDSTPYLRAANDGFDYSDVWLVDTANGSRSEIVKKYHYPVSPGRSGKYVAYYRSKAWWIYDVTTKTAKNASGNYNVSFEDEEDDHTVPEKPPATEPVWLADDRGVLISDEFDVFLARPDGGTTKLTDGRKDRNVYRFTDMAGEDDGPSIAKPLFFGVFDKDDKGSGLYSCDAQGHGKMLVFQQARIGGLKKAKDADRMVFTLGSFDQSPNLFITNLAFSQAKPESKTNPQQSNFYWPKEELVKYKSRWGKPLEGILIYPADYVKGREYPMITYIYERLSDTFYNYLGPNDSNPYNLQILSQNGYFLFEPDIAYKGNTPGQNAVDCLEPAVQAVLEKHLGVDPDRIGLMGHSWGAYQTAFVTTVSKVFKVGCAGAPLTDLVSMYNTHYWNTGIANAPLLETGQGRLRVPFWEDPKVYIDNSPVWRSMKRKAPILITVGDQDGAVDFHQGIALYNTLRRMGKECVLLVYYGENHNFTKEPDRIDYAHRLRHFMDVYLKGVKPEPWVNQGVPFIDREND